MTSYRVTYTRAIQKHNKIINKVSIIWYNALTLRRMEDEYGREAKFTSFKQ